MVAYLAVAGRKKAGDGGAGQSGAGQADALVARWGAAGGKKAGNSRTRQACSRARMEWGWGRIPPPPLTITGDAPLRAQGHTAQATTHARPRRCSSGRRAICAHSAGPQNRGGVGGGVGVDWGSVWPALATACAGDLRRRVAIRHQCSTLRLARVGGSEGLLPPSLRVVHKVPIPACWGGGGCWAISILNIGRARTAFGTKE